MTLKKPVKQPLVSFILPVYNADEFLQETLHSILEQTYTNFEVIAINDGSKDSSQKILEHYAMFDDRIKVHSRENRGLVATLNEAINLASGEFLARIDADDLCVPRRLEWQVSTMLANKNAVLCCGFYEMLSEDGEFLHKQLVPTHSDDLTRLMYTRNPIAHASVMLRKSLLPKELYNAYVGPTEDFEFWTRLAVNHPMVCTPHVIMRYRINTSGIMHTIGARQWKYIHQHYDNFWSKKGLPRVRSARELRRNMHRYLEENRLSAYGPGLIHLFYEGEAHLAIKCIKRGHVSHGLNMLLSTALSSRTGFRAVKKRIGLVIGGRKTSLPFWRQRQVEADSE